MDLASIPRRSGPHRVLAISGSLRAESSNTALLNAAARVAPADMTFRYFTGLGQLPHFNPDLDVAPRRPEAVERLRIAVAAADALLISSPEYAHGVPGSLKNGLDWLVSGAEFPAILVGLLSPSPYSTHAVAALRETLKTMSGDLPDSISLTVSPERRPVTTESLLADLAIAGILRQTMQSLANEIDRTRAEQRRLIAAAPW
jgi:NAD(P)H-dependent FMN reductase